MQQLEAGGQADRPQDGVKQDALGQPVSGPGERAAQLPAVGKEMKQGSLAEQEEQVAGLALQRGERASLVRDEVTQTAWLVGQGEQLGGVGAGQAQRRLPTVARGSVGVRAAGGQRELGPEVKAEGTQPAGRDVRRRGTVGR